MEPLYKFSCFSHSQFCSETFSIKKRSEIQKVSKEQGPQSPKSPLQSTQPPAVPTTCCQSSCPNCVWLDYAEKLSQYYADGGAEAMKAINRDIEDPNLREYLLFELRIKSSKF